MTSIPAERTAEDPEETVAATEVRALAAERLSFFADAVVAIAITLLALELPVPEGATNGELLHSVGEHRNEYVAFLISFVVIGGHWRAHHRLFRWVSSVDGGLTRLSFPWLLMQVLTPFATKVLEADGAFQTRFTFYAGVQVVAFAVFLLMIQRIRSQGLARTDTPSDIFEHSAGGIGAIAAGFAISIPVAFFTQWAYACWLAVPIGMAVVDRVRRRRAAG